MSDAARRLEFWFELASTYTYLSAMRIEAAAEARGVEVVWRPFLLGPIFKAQGWTTSPFNVYPAKGRYMVRDMQRLCAERGLPFAMPEPFPQPSLLAARLATVGAQQGWVPHFTRAVLAAEFGEGAQIGDPTVLSRILDGLGLDSDQILMDADGGQVKQRLREATSEAVAHGIFGAPTFRASDGELFWGDDRLDQAVVWAARL